VSFLYFNAEVTDSSGESIKFRDGVTNFLTSPLWTDFKQTFSALMHALWNQGWQESWKKLKDELDPFGEQQAFRVSTTGFSYYGNANLEIINVILFPKYFILGARFG